MKRGSKQKSLDGVSCSLLSMQENEQVNDLLGKRCVSLCTTVVQLFMALPHTPSTWTLQHTGVLCFVKDNPNRSYFIRLFDIKASKLIWEQELYNQFNYCKAKSFFHTLNADDCQVGLNFANEQEADSFFTAVDEKIRQRCSQLEKRNRKGQVPTEFPSTAPHGFGNSQLPLENIQNQAVPSKLKKEKKSKEKKNKKKGSKIAKELIGAPSGFTHVSHVGMENNSIDPNLMKLLSRAGISEADMNDSETSQLIYDVLERSGGMEALQKELNQQERPPPPPPSTRRTSLNSPSLSSTIPSLARLGPLPPPPGGSQFNESPRPSVKRTGPLPPPPGQTQVGRKGALPQPPSAATMPPRSGSLPVSGGHNGPPPPLPGERALPSLPSRSGPLPPPPGRAGAPSPFHEGTRRESLPPVPGGHNGPMPPVPGGRSGPPPPSLPGRRTGPTPPPPSNHSMPPPPPSKTFFSPPPADFPPAPMCNLPPPPASFDSYTPPQTNYGYSSNMFPTPMPDNSSHGGPPPPPAPPPPPPPPSAPSAPVSGSSQAPPVANTGGGGGGGGGGRGALLDQIRSGTKLKMVTASPNQPPSATSDSGEGIVGALMMVMQKRSQAIRPSDDEDDFDDEEDDDDEWD